MLKIKAVHLDLGSKNACNLSCPYQLLPSSPFIPSLFVFPHTRGAYGIFFSLPCEPRAPNIPSEARWIPTETFPPDWWQLRSGGTEVSRFPHFLRPLGPSSAVGNITLSPDKLLSSVLIHSWWFEGEKKKKSISEMQDYRNITPCLMINILIDIFHKITEIIGLLDFFFYILSRIKPPIELDYFTV